MATPCTISFQGKEYPYAEFASMLHDGLLDTFIKDGIVDPSSFKETAKQTQKEPPKTESTETGGRKKRKFTQQFAEEYPNLVSALKDDTVHYDQLPNSVTVSEANALIEYLGPEEAARAVKDISNGITWPTRMAMGQVLIKQYQAEGDYDSAIDMLEDVTIKATELGQGIQALSMFKFLSPEGQLRAAQREVNKQKKRLVDKNKKKINKVKEAIDQVNSEIVDQAMDNVEGKVNESDKVKPKPEPNRKTSYGSGNKIVSKKRYNDLKKQIKGKFFSNIPPELVEIAVYHMEASGRKFADFASQMISDFGKKVKPYLKTLYNKAKDQMSSSYSDFDSESEVDSQFEQIVGEDIFADSATPGATPVKKKPTARAIIKKHYTKNTGKSLKQSLMDEGGLDEREATDIANAVQKEFNKLSKEKKAEMLPKIIGKGKSEQAIVDELIKLSDTGALEISDVTDVFAEKMGWPKLTEENVREITRLTEAVQKAPEGFKQHRAIEKLLAYQANLNGISKWDVATSIWYANILSGYKTQAVNAASNMANSFGQFAVSALRNPKTAPMLVNAYWNGVKKGWLNAGDVMRTGDSLLRGKLEVPPTLERIDFFGGKYNPANYHKYVRRSMVAVDTIFYDGLKNMRAYQWANMLASDAGISPTDGMKKRAMDYMNRNDATVQEAKDQAQREYEEEVANGADPKQAQRDIKKRVNEIIDSQRSEEIQNESNAFGARGTFNYRPEGMLGFASEMLNNAGNKFPPFRLVVPFTNIIANVANEAINWTPFGGARGFTGGSISSKLIPGEKGDALRRKDWDTLSDRQKSEYKAELITKGLIGTSLMTMVYLLSQKWDDDDEPYLTITANGTGDYKKNYQLMETGWMPYSIKVGYRWYSYQNSPLNVAFSFIGNIRDYETHRKEKVTDEGLMQKMSIAAWNSKGTLLDMTFLKGLNTFLQTITDNQNEGAIEKSIQGVINTGKSVVVPNIYTQVFKDYQNVFDIPTKEVSNTTFGSFLRDIPVARNRYFDKVNVLGEPIMPNTDRFFSPVEDSPLFSLMADKKAFLSAPSIKKPLAIDGEERLLTQEEFYKYSTLRGQYIKDYMEKAFDRLSKMSNEDFAKQLSTIQSKGTKYAKLHLNDK